MTDDARPESQPDQQVGWQPGSAGYPPYGAPSQPPYDPAQPAPQPPYGAPYPGIPAQPPPGQPYPMGQQPADAPGQPGWTNSTPPGGMPTLPMAPSPQVPQQPVADPSWSSLPPAPGQPWPTAPRTDIPRPNQPTSAAPAPVSGSPVPQPDAPYSGPPYSGGYPGPISGMPASPAAQGYGAPGYAPSGYQSPAPSTPESLPWGPATPTPSSAGYAGIDHAGPRRIVPTPAQRKRPTFVLGLVIGLAVAVLAAGGGYFLGSSTAGGGSAAPAPSASASPSLNVYDANQKSLNQAVLDGPLATIAESWLTSVGSCAATGTALGPTLQSDELKHVTCRYGALSVQFAAYKTANDRDTERGWREQLHASSAALAPGQHDPAIKPGGVSGVQGDYVEYAIKGKDGGTSCGIWWDRVGETTAMYFEGLCKQGIGGNWDALRDLWARHS